MTPEMTFIAQFTKPIPQFQAVKGCRTRGPRIKAEFVRLVNIPSCCKRMGRGDSEYKMILGRRKQAGHWDRNNRGLIFSRFESGNVARELGLTRRRVTRG